jgi:hypothetical protein
LYRPDLNGHLKGISDNTIASKFSNLISSFYSQSLIKLFVHWISLSFKVFSENRFLKISLILNLKSCDL